MAAFFIYNKNSKINESIIKNHFQKIDIISYSAFSLGNYNLLLFQKQFLGNNNYYEHSNYSVFVVGSFVYKKHDYSTGLKNILLDYINNSISFSELVGIYTFIFFNKNSSEIEIIVDPSLSKNVYFDLSGEIITSHFLPLFKARQSSYDINHLAIWESVITGSLVPPDTYAKQINRLSQSNLKQLNSKNGVITFFRPKVETQNHNNRNNAIKSTFNLIDQYFSNFNELDQKFRSHIGLTGGLDSRLLLITAKEHLANLNANSFYRKNSLEYEIAKAIAHIAKLDFKTHERINYHEEEFINPEKSLLYLDGQIRSQNFINEPFSNPDYFNILYQNHLVGFHGCGGEQYRNADRFFKTISLPSFIQREWFKKQGIDFLFENEFKKKLIERVTDKITSELEINTNRIDLFYLKRLHNEIWNPANRLTRVNALNQSMLYFAPFSEGCLSYAAYRLIPFLGKGNGFQIDIMRQSNSNLNQIQTTYGYSITKGIGFHNRIIDNISVLLPRESLIKLYYSLKTKDKKSFEIHVPDSYNYLKKYLNQKNISKNKEVSSNLYALNHLYQLLTK